MNDRKRLELSTVLAKHVCTDGCEFNYFCAGRGEAGEAGGGGGLAKFTEDVYEFEATVLVCVNPPWQRRAQPVLVFSKWKESSVLHASN